MVRVFILSLGVFVILSGMPAMAADPGESPSRQDWSFQGIFGTYDRAAMQRGFLVYKQVCAACHSMSLLSYRNLEALGYTEAQINNIAADYIVIDGPNDEGDMYERPARASDRFVDPYENPQAAAFANNGAYPPDMSLIAKARHYGADYLYALLTGYEEAPEGETLLPGQYWNRYMPGHIISMAPPLADGMINYEDGAPETMSQYARDVTHFLAWAAEPHMEKRKQTGIMAFLFLLAFTLVMYGVKRRIWADQH